MKKIDFVSQEMDGVHIDSRNDISYVDPVTGKERNISNELHESHPLCVAEVYNRLSQRRWHNPIKKVIDGTSLYLIKDDLQRNPDVLRIEPSKPGVYRFNGTSADKDHLISLMGEEVDITSNDIIELESIMNSIAETNFYSSSKMEVDLEKGSITLDLMDLRDYTNTVSLVGVEKKFAKYKLTGKIDLTVKYSFDQGGKTGIYLQDFSFKAFEYEGTELNPILSRSNFVAPIKDVMVEYIDGVIRVIPNSEKVNECIISNCVVTYGCI